MADNVRAIIERAAPPLAEIHYCETHHTIGGLEAKDMEAFVADTYWEVQEMVPGICCHSAKRSPLKGFLYQRSCGP